MSSYFSHSYGGPQGSHMYVLTLELPGRLSHTSSGTWTPAEGMSRYDAFKAIKSDILRQIPELTRANVTFFSIEPNQL
ncbi:hypothetical protein ACFPM3_11315 [Streptomyces coeruleoprunus]|uniref:Uncharacterized protein n=1 Tax=Streptomyces coeruleoprunus TaxID=285563 RepID=A0ABV9XEW5_9ACTN